MKKVLFILACCFCLGVVAEDRILLAIAEPLNKGGLTAEEIAGLWGMLESSFPSGNTEYRLVSRSALKQMLEEASLTGSSGLVDMNSEQKAKMGKVKSVNYILVSELSKFGSQYNLTMRIVNASTGEVDTERTANLRAKTMDEVADKLEYSLENLLSDSKKMTRVALLYPSIMLGVYSTTLSHDLNTYMESILLESGVPLQNLKSVDKILKDNNLGALSELEPKMYKKVGKLLEVQNLIKVTVTGLEVYNNVIESPLTHYVGCIHTGKFSGSVSVISTETGEIVRSDPVEVTLDLGRTNGRGEMALSDEVAKVILKEAALEACKKIVGNRK